LQWKAIFYNLGIFDWASVTPSGAPEAVKKGSKVLSGYTNRNQYEMGKNIGAGFEVIPRTVNIPVGSVNRSRIAGR